MVREGHTEKVTFKERPEEDKEVSDTGSRRKCISTKGKCKEHICWAGLEGLESLSVSIKITYVLVFLYCMRKPHCPGHLSAVSRGYWCTSQASTWPAVWHPRLPNPGRYLPPTVALTHSSAPRRCSSSDLMLDPHT